MPVSPQLKVEGLSEAAKAEAEATSELGDNEKKSAAESDNSSDEVK